MTGAQIHILLVEDNPDHAELLLRDLERFPLPTHVHHVEDGEAAVDYVFGRNHFSNRVKFPLPQVILLDLRLPRLDGLEVLKLVKNHPPTGHVPVIILTTSDAERDVAAALAGRADKFLTKPASSQMLLQTLQDLGLGSPSPERSGRHNPVREAHA